MGLSIHDGGRKIVRQSLVDDFFNVVWWYLRCQEVSPGGEATREEFFIRRLRDVDHGLWCELEEVPTMDLTKAVGVAELAAHSIWVGVGEPGRVRGDGGDVCLGERSLLI